MTTQLLERDVQFDVLNQCWADAVAGNGRLVFVGGEAGVGKTSLVRRFCAGVPTAARVLMGACEPLATPVPLGPLLDMTPVLPDEFEQLVSGGGDPVTVRRRFLDEIGRTRAGTLVVIEDAHWADEATMDLLRHAARRLSGRHALLIVTYRDDEVGTQHSLRVLMGDVATLAEIRRIRLPPLSPGAVARLATGSAVDAIDLHRRTGGNPFFVAEVLAVGGDVVPTTVRDVVLARAARLSPDAREALDAAACLGARVPPDLVEEISGQGPRALDECLEAGMLVLADGLLTFRHDLARVAVEDAVPPRRAAHYHARALAALKGRPADEVDPGVLAGHAEKAGDRTAQLEYSLAAAKRAQSLGAHREAANHYGRVLAVADALPEEDRASILAARAEQAWFCHDLPVAIEAGYEALDRWRQLGNDLGRARCLLRLLNALLSDARSLPRVNGMLEEATMVLERLPATPELVMVCAGRSALATLAARTGTALEWAHRARRHADEVGDPFTAAIADLWLGLAAVQAGDDDGWALVEASIRTVGVGPFMTFSTKALFWPYHCAVLMRRYEIADRWFAEGMAYVHEHDIESVRQFFVCYRARQLMDQGSWDEAERLATEVLASHRLDDGVTLLAMEMLARLGVRRGDPGGADLLRQAQQMVEPAREIVEWLLRLPALEAELAWNSGDHDAVERLLLGPLDRAIALGEPWWLGEVAFWLWRVGRLDEPPAGLPEPYQLLLAGRWKEAHDAWVKLGCPYDAARALAFADDAGALRRALAVFDELGARSERDEAARRLRRLGIRDIPKAAARSNGAGAGELSPREAEVLTLLAEGLRNAEIAAKLFLSERTVEHHVASLLRKLETRSRHEAIKKARALGLVSGPGP